MATLATRARTFPELARDHEEPIGFVQVALVPHGLRFGLVKEDARQFEEQGRGQGTNLSPIARRCQARRVSSPMFGT